jgi:general stress protein YciG
MKKKGEKGVIAESRRRKRVIGKEGGYDMIW